MYRCILQDHLNHGKSIVFEAENELEFWTTSEWLESRGFFEKFQITFERPSNTKKVGTEEYLALKYQGIVTRLGRNSDTRTESKVLARVLRKENTNLWCKTKKEARIKTKGVASLFKRVKTEEGYKYYWIPAKKDPVLIGVRLDAKKYTRDISVPPVRRKVNLGGSERNEHELSCYICGGDLVLRRRRYGGFFYGCTNWKEKGCKGAINSLSSGLPDMQQYEENKLVVNG